MGMSCRRIALGVFLFYIVDDVLEGNFRRIFSPPFRKRGPNRFLCFHAGNIMAPSTAILANGSPSDIHQAMIFIRRAKQFDLGTLERA